MNYEQPGMETLVVDLAHAFQKAGGRALLVGGAVRDALMGVPAKDADLEVHELEPRLVEDVAGRFGKVHVVGKRFAVLHLSTDCGQIEISLPRRESKTGPGHQGFEISADPWLGVEEASKRRDFTVNAMMQDPLTGELMDPWGGQADLRRGLLRHVSPAFAEDPLRVLRAARFASRFGWNVHAETAALCRSLDLSELPRERLETEWKDILVRGAHPGKGLQVLEDVGALRFFPEVAALRGVPQDPVWHPEGDVFHHTCLCLQAAVKVRPMMEDPWAEMLGVLCHDLGKATTTSFERGRWRAINHDTEGAPLTERFLKRITNQEDLIAKVKSFVREHLRPTQLMLAGNVSDAAIRRLALRVDIKSVIRVAWADAAGREDPSMPSWEEWPVGHWLLERATQLGVRDEVPQPFLLGRDLLEHGMAPGKAIGVLLGEAFDLQLEGDLKDREDALAWLAQRLRKS